VLVNEPHFLSAWLSQHRRDYEVSDGRVVWKRNPLEVLSDTYRLVDMVGDEGAAAECIWGHDRELLDTGLAFYAALAERVPAGTPWLELDARLRGPAPSFGLAPALWARVQSAHVGHQLGMEILGLVPLIGATAGFFELRLADDLTPIIPAALQEKAQQEASKKLLAPPPVSRSDEIAAAMGGVYWDREAPTLPAFVEVGMHFDKGQPLYIIEVMKMFNKVYAPFAGRIVEIFVHDNGATVRKGQPLFRIEPDEKFVAEDPAERRTRIRTNTDAYLANLL
jgi:biotin carboxyl carrier protein